MDNCQNGRICDGNFEPLKSLTILNAIFDRDSLQMGDPD
jgi:hypothetical protein